MTRLLPLKGPFILPLITLLLALCAGAASAKSPDQLREEFMDIMVQKHGFERARVKAILWQARTQKGILKAIARPAEKVRPWWKYRPIFLQDKRIQGGARFWRENQAALQQAEKKYGVPPQIITAILGVETYYGKITLKHSVLDALHTLGFHYPRRGKFFRQELKHFLLLTREENMDPTKVMGSYAGAMGIPQFMPSSYRRLAIDFDGDGKRDIWKNNVDVIGSIANYLARNGWKRGTPVAARVTDAGKEHLDYVGKKLTLDHKIADLRKAGIGMPKQLPDSAKASLVRLQQETGPEYWVRLNNFRSILRYNPRNKYAMAVFQLSEAIKGSYQQQAAE